MATKKKKLADLDEKSKTRIVRTSVITLSGVAIICCILVGCFACKQNIAADDIIAEMTPENKADYWKAQIIDVTWSPQTDETHNGILKDMYIARDAHTELDAGTQDITISFLHPTGDVFVSAIIVLTDENGEIHFNNEDKWKVKFSEANDEMCMTITDSAEKTVYYSPK